MIDNNIKIKDTDILRIGLQNSKGEPILDKKGETVHWVFDLADIELPLKYNKLESRHKQNLEWVRNQFIIIDKKQDVKGKYLLSKNEEEKIRAMNEFYKKEEELLDVFLGKGGVKKYLNGRNYYWDMFDDINEALEPLLPLFQNTMDNIGNRIKDKYSKSQTEENVLE